MAVEKPNTILLYSKPDCHLCELAYDLVRGLSQTYELQVAKIDITTDASLWEKFWDKIPVLVINDEIVLTAPIRIADVRAALDRR